MDVIEPTVTKSAVMPVKWKLPDFLEANGIKPYTLWKEIGTDINIKSVYNLTNTAKPPTSVNFQTINLLLPALERLTGKQVSMGDVMEYER